MTTLKNLTSMRFKDFTWPHNPRVYSIEYERVMAENKVPFGQYFLQDLGRTRRVMRGEGEFVGDYAYMQFGALANVFYQGGTGVLVHPVWQAANAYLVELKLEQMPRPNYVKYSFVFWEDTDVYSQEVQIVTPVEEAGEAGTGGSGAVHIVCRGESLWSIAKQYGLALDVLISMNGQLKNPNLIYVGDEVNVG